MCTNFEKTACRVLGLIREKGSLGLGEIFIEAKEDLSKFHFGAGSSLRRFLKGAELEGLLKETDQRYSLTAYGNDVWADLDRKIKESEERLHRLLESA